MKLIHSSLTVIAVLISATVYSQTNKSPQKTTLKSRIENNSVTQKEFFVKQESIEPSKEEYPTIKNEAIILERKSLLLGAIKKKKEASKFDIERQK